MDGITDHATTTADVRTRSRAPSGTIRPEILEVLRQGSREGDSDRMRQNYQNAFDRLFAVLGQSHEMAFASWLIASNIAMLIGDRDPKGWRVWGDTYGDPFLEKAVREFEEFQSLFFNRARKLLSTATQMQECVTVYDKLYHKELADLIEALQPFGCPRARAADPRSEWHTTAVLFAERIEAHFRTLKLDPPKRSSARSPLVLAVQSLLDMLGLHLEAETIRKVL